MARTKKETAAERSELESIAEDAERVARRARDKIDELEEAESAEDAEERLDVPRRMPAQKPGRSKQDYATPMELIRAVEKRWGVIVHDLCAHAQNARVASFYSKEQDCFKQAWAKDFPAGNLWGNPEFGGGFIAPFAEKAYVESRQRDGLIIMLTPASIGSEWFANHVEKKALVIGLRPRLSFDGINPYPKDCMLSLYGRDLAPGFETWRWDAEK